VEVRTMSTCYRRTIFIALPLLLLLTVSPRVALGGLNGDGKTKRGDHSPWPTGTHNRRRTKHSDAFSGGARSGGGVLFL